MKNYEGWTINAGFLAGNIILGESRAPIDESASCAKYKEMCHNALEKEFPGATVLVPYQLMASGGEPMEYKTWVQPPGDLPYLAGECGEEGKLAEEVDEICGKIWEMFEWIVFDEEKMQEQAEEICANAFKNKSSYWSVVNELRDIGLRSKRAKRMARHALTGNFLWKGEKTKLKTEAVV